MATLNRDPSEAMMKVGVNACTDVTGFGLMGHLTSMVRGSGVGATVRLADVPVLPGARELLAAGTAPGGTYRNMNSVADSTDWDDSLTEEDRLLLCDAQTSGGLLISVPSENRDRLVGALHEAAVPTVAVIGEITVGPEGRVSVLS
jgi:selenide,water dikinase